MGKDIELAATKLIAGQVNSVFNYDLLSGQMKGRLPFIFKQLDVRYEPSATILEINKETENIESITDAEIDQLLKDTVLPEAFNVI